MKKKILFVLVFIAIIGITCFIIDTIRVKNNKNPICSFKYIEYTDGNRLEEGSCIYYGLGYKIFRYANVTMNANYEINTTYEYEIVNLFKKQNTDRIVKSLQLFDERMQLLQDRNQ